MTLINYSNHPSKASPVGTDIIPLWDPVAGAARNATINAIINARITGGGTIATGGNTLTIPATGTAALLAQAQTFTALQTFSAGLAFGGDTLQSYQVGTWTPQIADANSGGNIASIGTNSGQWVRIGRFVSISWRCLSINTAGMTGGNTLVIRDLPFAIESTNPGIMCGIVRLANVTFSGSGYVLPAIFTPSVIVFSQSISGSGNLNLTVADFTSGSANCTGSITYITNDP